MARWFHNGSEIDTVSVNDRGLQYADGLFETIALRGGQPRLWELHSERMQISSRRLGIDLPADTTILSGLTAAVDATGNSSQDALLKIIITRGEGDRGYAPPLDANPTILFGVFNSTEHPAERYQKGIAVRFCNSRLSSQPQTAGIKLLSRLDQVLARAEWQDADIADGLMLDQNGCVVCGTMSNLFVVMDGTLITPEITLCGVSGVMRQHILALAEKNNVPIAVDRISPESVMDADEIFLCNSQYGIWPVSRCGKKRIADWPLTNEIMALLRASGVVEGPE
jgi:4-amino-4-deoxychorismate lyase